MFSKKYLMETTLIRLIFNQIFDLCCAMYNKLGFFGYSKVV